MYSDDHLFDLSLCFLRWFWIFGARTRFCEPRTHRLRIRTMMHRFRCATCILYRTIANSHALKTTHATAWKRLPNYGELVEFRGRKRHSATPATTFRLFELLAFLYRMTRVMNLYRRKFIHTCIHVRHYSARWICCWEKALTSWRR